MTVSRKIVELWQVCHTRNPQIDLFDQTNADALLELPEYGLAYDALEKHTDNPHMAILLSLRALEIQRSELAEKISDTELAITAPASTFTSARPTLFVIREMIESARREIVIAGYRITNQQIGWVPWPANQTQAPTQPQTQPPTLPHQQIKLKRPPKRQPSRKAGSRWAGNNNRPTAIPKRLHPSQLLQPKPLHQFQLKPQSLLLRNPQRSLLPKQQSPNASSRLKYSKSFHPNPQSSPRDFLVGWMG